MIETEPPAIEIEKLCKTFDHFIALDRLDLVVPRGGIVGLLGPNGAGKSTAIKILTTLLDASAGRARVAGFDVARQPLAVRRKIGYVPQLLSADGALTARENLNLSARLYGLYGARREARVAEALALASLAEVANHLVKTFSGGMVRRLEIAQATLHYPEVLFLDEPTIGLDPAARRTVWDRLLQMRTARGMTMLISTHDMEEAEALCDEIAMLLRGRLQVVGKPDALKARVGPGASLADVFVHFSGLAFDHIEHGGRLPDVVEGRAAATRRG